MHLNVLHRYRPNIIWSLEIFDTTTSLIDTSLFLHFVHKERGRGQSDFSWTVVALYSYVPLTSVFLCIITSEIGRLPYRSSTIKKNNNNGIKTVYSITERGWFRIRPQIISIISFTRLQRPDMVRKLPPKSSMIYKRHWMSWQLRYLICHYYGKLTSKPRLTIIPTFSRYVRHDTYRLNWLYNKYYIYIMTWFICQTR